MLATTSHCLKLAIKHHTHKVLGADLKIQKLLMCPKKKIIFLKINFKGRP